MMRVPSDEYYNKLLDQYAVPEPIRRHCSKVADVGTFIARRLSDAGVAVDIELVRIGCLMHDAFKSASLPSLDAKPEWGYVPSEHEIAVWRELRQRFSGIHETLVAADIIRIDFPEFSDFVSKIGSTGNPTYLTERLELKILHYADWRVQFDQITSFDDRLAYLREAYKDKWIDRGKGWWEQTLQKEKELEMEIFKHLQFRPEELCTALAAREA